jgi:hypothetical protein
MFITNAKKTSDTEWDFDLKASADEVEYLVNLAVGILIVNGQIALQEQDNTQEVQVGESTNETNQGLN